MHELDMLRVGGKGRDIITHTMYLLTKQQHTSHNASNHQLVFFLFRFYRDLACPSFCVGRFPLLSRLGFSSRSSCWLLINMVKKGGWFSSSLSQDWSHSSSSSSAARLRTPSSLFASLPSLTQPHRIARPRPLKSLPGLCRFVPPKQPRHALMNACFATRVFSPDRLARAEA